jgi:DNA-binding CsgD family transcriptional regulator
LSPREWEVLALLVGGASNRAIAARLRISPHTVVQHVASLMAKLEAESRGHAVALALGVGAAPEGRRSPAGDPGTVFVTGER